jgi:hypothetical protein
MVLLIERGHRPARLECDEVLVVEDEPDHHIDLILDNLAVECERFLMLWAKADQDLPEIREAAGPSRVCRGTDGAPPARADYEDDAHSPAE